MPAVEGVAYTQVAGIGTHIGAPEIREQGLVQPPGHEKVILGPCPLDGWTGIAVHIDPGDVDDDGILDNVDNCLETPNGPDEGTCVKGKICLPYRFS